MTPAIPRTLARRILRRAREDRRDITTITILDSRSMAPLIRGQCSANVQWGVPHGALRRGCLIVAGWDDLLIIHRVIAVSRLGGHMAVLQMADNLDPGNPFGATWIDVRDVLGVVTHIRTMNGATRYDCGWWLSRAIDHVAARQGQFVWTAMQQRQRTRLVVLRTGRMMTFAFAALAVRLAVGAPVIGSARAEANLPTPSRPPRRARQR